MNCQVMEMHAQSVMEHHMDLMGSSVYQLIIVKWEWQGNHPHHAPNAKEDMHCQVVHAQNVVEHHMDLMESNVYQSLIVLQEQQDNQFHHAPNVKMDMVSMGLIQIQM